MGGIPASVDELIINSGGKRGRVELKVKSEGAIAFSCLLIPSQLLTSNY